MTLHEPFQITPRLLPGLKIGSAWVSLEHVGYTHDGRDRYRWYVDLPQDETGDREYSESDLRSGVQGATYQQMFGTLLVFLSACAEGRRYQDGTGRMSENADLFPDEVGQWAEEHSDEIDSLLYTIEEGGEVLIAE